MVYIDESGDDTCSIMSALAIPSYSWQACFNHIRDWRKSLNERYGLAIRKELHAFKFVAGRGRPSRRIIDKSTRAEIFREALRLCAGFGANHDACLFNVCVGQRAEYLLCCEWLMNRIQRYLSSFAGNAVLFFDSGYENGHTKLLRRMRVFNRLPSHYPPGYYDAPVVNILEDPVFRDSAEAPFIQLVDFCAYALLRKQKSATRADKYAIGEAFSLLEPVLMRKASNSDPFGIIRPPPRIKNAPHPEG
jgi:hypothetical protein